MGIVSIVLPTYNGEKFIKYALDSIIAQTYSNWELIIVNDCSTDNTLEIVNEYAAKDNRIKVVTNDVNLKIAKSLNKGFSLATGNYWTWTSDDNYYLPTAIEKMVNYLDEHPSDMMVYADYVKKDEVNNYEEKESLDISPLALLKQCVCGPCFLYRREVALAVGEYDYNIPLAQDYDYWMRMYLHGNIAHLPESLYVYRFHKDCLSCTATKQVGDEDGIVKDKYEAIYAERFPETASYVKARSLLKKYELSGDVSVLISLENEYTKKFLYSQYKKKYKSLHNHNFIKAIYHLGLIYRLKGFLFYLAQRSK